MEPVLEPSAERFESVPIGESAADTTPLPNFMAENSNGYDADKEHRRLVPPPLTPPNNVLTHLKEDVDPAQATVPLVAYCFMTGLMYGNIFFFLSFLSTC